jgi:hypothetical protein
MWPFLHRASELRRVAPSSKWSCSKKTFEWVKTSE